MKAFVFFFPLLFLDGDLCGIICMNNMAEVFHAHFLESDVSLGKQLTTYSFLL